MPALIVQSGAEAGRRLEVEAEHTIGREDQEFTLSDVEVSRRHAVVRATASGIEIEDVGSSNGTFVNGDRIAGVTQLSDGDEVRLGQTTLSVEAPRAQATRISAAPPVDPGATVVRPSADVPPPAGVGAPGGVAETPQAAPPPADYVAPQPEGERPAPDGPPDEPAPSEPEPPGYRPPGHEEPLPSVPAPGDYEAPQPEQPAATSGPQPDFVTDADVQSDTSQPQPGQAPGAWQGGGGQYPSTEEQPAFGGVQQEGLQGAAPGFQQQGAYGPPGESAHSPPGAPAWQGEQQQAYSGQVYSGAGYAGEKKSNTWLWIVLAVVVVLAIAAAVFFFVL